jgi:hypothetical protein
MCGFFYIDFLQIDSNFFQIYSQILKRKPFEDILFLLRVL